MQREVVSVLKMHDNIEPYLCCSINGSRHHAYVGRSVTFRVGGELHLGIVWMTRVADSAPVMFMGAIARVVLLVSERSRA